MDKFQYSRIKCSFYLTEWWSLLLPICMVLVGMMTFGEGRPTTTTGFQHPFSTVFPKDDGDFASASSFLNFDSQKEIIRRTPSSPSEKVEATITSSSPHYQPHDPRQHGGKNGMIVRVIVTSSSSTSSQEDNYGKHLDSSIPKTIASTTQKPTPRKVIRTKARKLSHPASAEFTHSPEKKEVEDIFSAFYKAFSSQSAPSLVNSEMESDASHNVERFQPFYHPIDIPRTGESSGAKSIHVPIIPPARKLAGVPYRRQPLFQRNDDTTTPSPRTIDRRDDSNELTRVIAVSSSSSSSSRQHHVPRHNILPKDRDRHSGSNHIGIQSSSSSPSPQFQRVLVSTSTSASIRRGFDQDDFRRNVDVPRAQQPHFRATRQPSHTNNATTGFRTNVRSYQVRPSQRNADADDEHDEVIVRVSASSSSSSSSSDNDHDRHSASLAYPVWAQRIRTTSTTFTSRPSTPSTTTTTSTTTTPTPTSESPIEQYQPQVWGEPAKVWGEPARVWGEPAKVWSEPARVWGEPAKVWGWDGSPITVSPTRSTTATRTTTPQPRTRRPNKTTRTPRYITKMFKLTTPSTTPSKYSHSHHKFLSRHVQEEDYPRDEPPTEGEEEEAGTFVILGEDDPEQDSIDGAFDHHLGIPPLSPRPISLEQFRAFNFTYHHTFNNLNLSNLARSNSGNENDTQIGDASLVLLDCVDNNCTMSSNSSLALPSNSSSDSEESSSGSGEDGGAKFGYILEGTNVRRYRVEERTPDGFIVGEYGVLNNQNAFLRGVRYTADGTINPRLIHEALMKFLSL